MFHFVQSVDRRRSLEIICDSTGILRPILQRLSEAEKPGLSIHPCFPLIIRLCRGHVSLWSRSFLTSARTQSRLPRSMADQKFPTLMSCQNRRKPKVSNFANDFKTQAPRENVSYFNVRSQAAATTGFLGLRFAPPQALNRAAPSAFNKRRNKVLTAKNILCALSLSPCLYVSVVNPLGVIGNRSLPPQDPRKNQRRHNRCIRFDDKFRSIEG